MSSIPSVRRVAVVCLVVALVSALAAGCSSSSSTPSPPSGPTTPATTRPRAKLEIREIRGTHRSTDTLCGAADRHPSVLFDRTRRTCYLVGPTLLTGVDIDSANAGFDSTKSQWVVNVHWKNDDFVTKVANPMVNRLVAIVLDGVVQSAPYVNPGITGRDVEISGDYTKADAGAVAAGIMGVAPPKVR